MPNDAPTTVSVSRPIEAPPDKVWSLIADLARMGDWSPENTGGTWVKGATGPAVGAHFKGGNSNGKRQWRTNVVVTACEEGKVFTFDVSSYGLSVATWSYTIEPRGAGCTVTETWTDKRGRMVKSGGKRVSGVDDRAEHNRAGMEQTLANLAAAVEG